MFNVNVKTGEMFTELKSVDISVLDRLNNFLKTDLSPYERSNSYRPGFFDGSVFIRYPNASLVKDEHVYNYLYTTNFNGIKNHPHRFIDEKWNSLVKLTEPLVNHILGVLPVPCEAIAAEINILPPGVNILPHVDKHQLLQETHRVHIVLDTNDKVFMFGDKEEKHWPKGSCFIFDNTLRHNVKNDGNTNRAHLVVDCLPLEYVEYINNAHVL